MFPDRCTNNTRKIHIKQVDTCKYDFKQILISNDKDFNCSFITHVNNQAILLRLKLGIWLDFCPFSLTPVLINLQQIVYERGSHHAYIIKKADSFCSQMKAWMGFRIASAATQKSYSTYIWAHLTKLILRWKPFERTSSPVKRLKWNAMLLPLFEIEVFVQTSYDSMNFQISFSIK